MAYLLDSNVWIAVLRNRSSSITQRMASITNPAAIFSCAVVRAELVHGAYRSDRTTVNLQMMEKLLERYPSLPFDDAAADIYGRIRSDLERRGIQIGANDYQIASIALANDLTVVTHNTGEFSRVPGLKFEDWQTP